MTPFVFQSPGSLLLLLLLIPVAWLLHRAQRRRNEVHHQMGSGMPRRTTLRDGIRLFALTLLVLALARPGINPQRHSFSETGRDVVFVLDVSQSMLATDAYPSRLEAAKDGIRDALNRFRSERVALVIYAGSANILCPLTHDYGFVRYMVDQAAPRAVDFGGTTLLPATEKCVDSILTSERSGFQDLVVLTDGEDHQANHRRIAELLRDQDAGLLIVGLGDAARGSRIPIQADDGSTVDLKHDDEFVTTWLKETALRELTGMLQGSAYISAGTNPFDLGDLYAQYAVNKPVAGTAGGETYVDYFELGFPLMGVALGLLLFTELQGVAIRSAAPGIAGLMCLATASFVSGSSLWADEPAASGQFDSAMRLQALGRSAEALEAYARVDACAVADLLSPSQLAALRFNQGLCLLELASATEESQPRSALSFARLAQVNFLEACRMNPSLHRAGRRLDPTARKIAQLAARIEEEDRREDALQAQLQALAKLLQQLNSDQITLRKRVPPRPNQNAPKRRQPRPPAPAPKTAAADSQRFSQEQRQLHATGISIRSRMQELDRSISVPRQPGEADSVSMLREPIRLMGHAIDAQQRATNQLRAWSSWPSARDQQQVAIAKIQEILDLLASDSSRDPQDGDREPDEEYDEMMEASDAEDATMESLEGQGDFARSKTMQPLPIPNYSVADILMEEQGSLQFRQQQRAKSNRSKVEKDW